MKGTGHKISKAVDIVGWSAFIVGIICIVCIAAAVGRADTGGLAATPAPECREDSLVRFIAKGVEMPSQVIGDSDKCDSFGGNLIYTPKHSIYLYVNFNIKGTVDLDEVDAARELIPESGEMRDWFIRIKLAVVDKDWIKRVYNDSSEAIVNFGGDTLFVSETVVQEGRFAQVLRDFYSHR